MAIHGGDRLPVCPCFRCLPTVGAKRIHVYTAFSAGVIYSCQIRASVQRCAESGRRDADASVSAQGSVFRVYPGDVEEF